MLAFSWFLESLKSRSLTPRRMVKSTGRGSQLDGFSAGNTTFNNTNACYANISLKDTIGKTWFNRLSAEQKRILKNQMEVVQETGVQSRYWHTPGWPISLRDMLVFKLTGFGVGALNVEDLVSAKVWNWHQCIVQRSLA